MKQVKAILMILLTGCLLSIAINCLAADSTSISSTSIRQDNIKPMKSDVVLSEECIKTPEVAYSVSMITSGGAQVTCDPNMVMKKTIYRTDQFFTDVTTYVSAICCKHQLVWKQAESGQPPPA